MALDSNIKPFSWGKPLEKKAPLIAVKIFQIIGGEKFDCETTELETVEAGKIWLFDLGYVKLPAYIPPSINSGYMAHFWNIDRLVQTFRLTKPFPG